MTKLTHITTVPDMLSFLVGQVAYMKRQGFEVEAISSSGNALDHFAASEDIAVHIVSMARRITPLRDLVALARLWRLLRQSQPQIVHTHSPKAGLLGILAAWLARVPVRIYHVHGLPLMTATGLKYELLRWSEKVSSAFANLTLCDSHSVREVCIAKGLCPPERIRVLLGGSVNGVDAEGAYNPARVEPQVRANVRVKYKIPVEAPVVGIVARLVRDKGVSELVAAWSMLREEFPSLHLLVVGRFEPQDPVPAEVEAVLREDPRIHLTGPVSEVTSFYAAMDIVTLPSYREGLPVVPLEAAAMELPVVATLIPGVVDAVEDGATGTLVPVHDAVALAAALRVYIRDPTLRREHGRAGRRRVLSKFRQEAIWTALEQEYQRQLRVHGVTT